MRTVFSVAFVSLLTDGNNIPKILLNCIQTRKETNPFLNCVNELNYGVKFCLQLPSQTTFQMVVSIMCACVVSTRVHDGHYVLAKVCFDFAINYCFMQAL